MISTLLNANQAALGDFKAGFHPPEPGTHRFYQILYIMLYTTIYGE